MELHGSLILVVDDEPDEAAFAVAALDDAGAEVAHAHNADEALRLARSRPPALVTLDLSMPGMDPVTFLDQLFAEPGLNGVHVCVVSGRPELRRVIVDRYAAAGQALGWVDKPYSADELVERVRELLGR